MTRIKRLDYYKDLVFKYLLKLVKNADRFSFTVIASGLKLDRQTIERSKKAVDSYELEYLAPLMTQFDDLAQFIDSVKKVTKIAEDSYEYDKAKNIIFADKTKTLSQKVDEMRALAKAHEPLTENESQIFRIINRCMISRAVFDEAISDEAEELTDRLPLEFVEFKPYVTKNKITAESSSYSTDPVFTIEFFVSLNDETLKLIAALPHIKDLTIDTFSFWAQDEMLFSYDENDQSYYYKNEWLSIGGLLSN